MSTAETTKRLAAPRLRNRVVLGYYLLSIATGAFLLFAHGRLAFAADLVAALLYLTVTALLYGFSGPRDGSSDRKEERI